MNQLVQLQESYDKITAKNAEVIAVFREEKAAEEGLEKSRTKTGANFPLALDTDAEQTAAYSQSGFHTYVIDTEGKIAAILEGNLMKRATAEDVLEALP